MSFEDSFFLQFTKMDPDVDIGLRWSAGIMTQFDSWIKKHGGMPRRLIRPSHMNPGDRLFRIWKAFKAHAHDVVHRGDVECLDVDIECAYRDTYVSTCHTEDEKVVARTEVQYNVQLVRTWCVYTLCHDNLDMCGWDRDEVAIAKTWMEHQLTLLQTLETSLRDAQRIRDSGPADVKALRIRIPILKKHCVCGNRAKHRFEGNGWTEKMCAPCYQSASEEDRSY